LGPRALENASRFQRQKFNQMIDIWRSPSPSIADAKPSPSEALSCWKWDAWVRAEALAEGERAVTMN